MTTDPPSSPDPGGPTVLRILVGSHLKRLRVAHGVTRARAAHLIRGSEAKLSRMEAGRVSFKRRDLEDLLTLYGHPDGPQREEILALADRANEPGWWQPYHDAMPDWLELYVGLEQAASSIRTYEPLFVPGLLQTERYAHAVLDLGSPGRPEEVERRVALRLGRRRLLERPDAPAYWAVIDEAALRRPIGGPQTMADQLGHLLAVTDLPNVTVQILPLDQSGAAPIGGPFILLRNAQADLPDVVYLEQLTSALYLDKRTEVETYLRLIDQLAAVALTPRRSAAMIAGLLRA